MCLSDDHNYYYYSPGIKLVYNYTDIIKVVDCYQILTFILITKLVYNYTDKFASYH